MKGTPTQTLPPEGEGLGGGAERIYGLDYRKSDY